MLFLPPCGVVLTQRKQKNDINLLSQLSINIGHDLIITGAFNFPLSDVNMY